MRPNESPHNLDGNLAYMSLEQTGRMNRPVDFRTDFYSLGVTLYELFTGNHYRLILSWRGYGCSHKMISIVQCLSANAFSESFDS